MNACRVPRLAFFADCLFEANGVALTSRQLEAYARRRGFPTLLIYRSQHNRLLAHSVGSLERLALPRSLLAFAVDADLRFDPLFASRLGLMKKALERFAPDVVHVTSPGDLGLAGVILAHRLRLPLVASWHTNLHAYAARRLERRLGILPQKLRTRVCALTGDWCWKLTTRFYRLARVILAPNPELADALQRATGKPVYLMARGVDTQLFHPHRRRRGDDALVVGYVGRLTPEKNVRALALVEAALERSGTHNFRLLVVGDGSEGAWLRQNLRRAQFTGRLEGDALADAYASMDIFVFPSRTDTYGNVVQEALASGVPVVATDQGGPRHIVAHGRNGLICRSDEELAEAVVELAHNPGLRQSMRQHAVECMQARSWDAVFDGVWRVYAEVARCGANSGRRQSRISE